MNRGDMVFCLWTEVPAYFCCTPLPDCFIVPSDIAPVGSRPGSAHSDEAVEPPTDALLYVAVSVFYILDNPTPDAA